MGGWESPSHWLIIAIVVVVLFGYKKLPDAAKAVGRSLRAFKTELRGEDDASDTAKAAPGPASAGSGAAGADPAARTADQAQRAEDQPAKQPE
jgi:sec-independent protein translocase protein TatA